jgi:hypothetical protein
MSRDHHQDHPGSAGNLAFPMNDLARNTAVDIRAVRDARQSARRRIASHNVVG